MRKTRTKRDKDADYRQQLDQAGRRQAPLQRYIRGVALELAVALMHASVKTSTRSRYEPVQLVVAHHLLYVRYDVDAVFFYSPVYKLSCPEEALR